MTTPSNQQETSEPTPAGVRLTKKLLRAVLVALVSAVAASLVRVVFLSVLETRITWITFYPAVTLAALWSGFASGILSTIFSCLIVIHGWQWFADRPFITTAADWIGMIAFVLNCVMISAVAESSRRARKRADKAREEAEAANRAKSVFLASMSHELRTPLNAILGFSSLLRMDPKVSEEQRQSLDIINRSGDHLLGLINDVLDMARIESGRTVLEPTDFDVTAQMLDLVSLLKPRAEEKGLELRLARSSDFPRWIHADAAKLRQVVINLIGNAIKFTDQGEVTLHLDAEENVASKRLILEIKVEDTGIGIAPADQKRIFEPFVQVAGSSARKGSGLGLAITRQHVALMGGAIDLESTPGKGSTFRLTLPVERAAQMATAAEADQGAIAGLAAGQPEQRILIVEDNPDNSLLLCSLLEKAGLTTRLAENGTKGVLAFQSWRPHFIFMDCRMPVMDGLEATRRIRALPDGDRVKIVAITASVFKEERDHVLAAGMDDLMKKPFHPDEIYDCLARHLGLRFVRAAGVAGSGGPASGVTPAAMATLPATLRADLCAALSQLDQTRIAELVALISRENAALGRALQEQTKKFRYTALLKSLRAVNDDPDGTENVQKTQLRGNE